MKCNADIRQALAQTGLCTEIADIRDLSGGCIHHVKQIKLADGTDVVAKLNRASHAIMFHEEAEGLRTLSATNTVLVPQPLAVQVVEASAIFLMTLIEVMRSETPTHAWRRFGEELAALHQHDAGQRYGFPTDNHIGATLQPNAWNVDWVEFNRINRLGFQLELAIDNQRLDAREVKAIQNVIDRLGEFIPTHPYPSLLHGDLWSGNALPATGNRIALIDPACSIGDGWADIAMMQLFGGFPSVCFDAYREHVTDRDGIQDRISVYQLYHVLNHLNLFGRSYASQALRMARELVH